MRRSTATIRSLANRLGIGFPGTLADKASATSIGNTMIKMPANVRFTTQHHQPQAHGTNGVAAIDQIPSVNKQPVMKRLAKATSNIFIASLTALSEMFTE